MISPTDPFAYLLGLEQLGIKFGLDQIRTICDRLGHPERHFQSIIVAGTNGKGSVTAMVHQALRAAGIRGARYTSPHLVHLEERFVIDGDPVSTSALRDTTSLVQASVEQLLEEGVLSTHPTFFEVTTAVALELFRRERVAVAVLEVGMGGRFDATNVVTPIAAAITNIDFDHERYLGNTIAAIAGEKAGVIKPGIPVVVGDMKTEAVDVIARACDTVGARYIPATEQVTITSFSQDQGRARLTLETPLRRYGPLSLRLRGRHQVVNALVAVRLLEELASTGLRVNEAAVRSGLEEVRWPARLDLVDAGAGRRALIDAAHNPAGAASLARYLDEWYPAGLPVVFGAMNDKDIAGMLTALLPRASRLIVTRARTSRAADPEAIVGVASGLAPSCPLEAVPIPSEALDRAWQFGKTVCVAGSIFLAGELLEQIARARTSGRAPA